MREELCTLIEDVLSLRDTLVRAIVMDQVMAEGIAQIAAEHEGRIGTIPLDDLRRLGRHHRVKAMELKGRLAALEAKYPTILEIDEQAVVPGSSSRDDRSVEQR